ncbi:MAG: hypothetical protein JRJ12_08540 [Deltaproteobacteria bacterium]|nr:hypothetical protein [Deltaproteobacteria bacterium]MBW2071554.1 hypothetical protein [Deltaproteobacteria bacterium]
MKTLVGLQEYLDQHYHRSVFEEAVADAADRVLHVHGGEILVARIVENTPYDIGILPSGEKQGGGSEPLTMPKLDVKLVYPAEIKEKVAKRLKNDAKVEKLQLAPSLSARDRHHIKNKSLYPLMKERVVVFFTLLGGEIVRGLIAAFSRYEITVNLKGGVPVTILRHAVYDLRDKKGNCYLKSVQQKTRDWEKSPLFQ